MTLQADRLAGLSAELAIPWVQNTEFSTGNISEASKLWEAIDFDSGVVALDLESMREEGIPQSQPFPWDHSKGLYIVNAYHSIHCLVSVGPECCKIRILIVVKANNTSFYYRVEYREAANHPASSHQTLSRQPPSRGHVSG